MRMRERTAAALLTALLAAIPGAAEARRQVRVDTGRSAAELEARANALADREGNAMRSAALWHEAALLRGPGDPRGAENLISAAMQYDAAHRVDRAYELLVAASVRALQAGDAPTAAQASLSAARLALRRDRPEHARRHVARARLLALLPSLDASTRQSLRGEIRSVLATM